MSLIKRGSIVMRVRSAKVEANARVSMTAEERLRLEEDADKKWDEFYGTHKAGFFKDRNWLFTEFPELLQLAQAEVRYSIQG